MENNAIRSCMLSVAVVAMVSTIVVPVIASTKHVVGGSTGWTIPSNASFYSEWAATRNITVGDSLVFTFPTGIHNVFQVPKSSYDACTTQNNIGSSLTTGPATVVISSAGTHYFICGVSGHCSFGQKLAITVKAASPKSSPSSKAASPTPTPTPALVPSPSTPVFATPPSQLSSPSPSPSPSQLSSPSPLGSPSLSSTSPSPSPSPLSPAPSSFSPSPSPLAPSSSVGSSVSKKHAVGDSTGWTIPSNASFYSEWAASQNFTVGDTLEFDFPTGIHDVIEVPKSSYDACTTQSQIGSTLTTGPATVKLSKAGAHYYICGVSGHCSFGQKLAITVLDSSATPSSVPSSPEGSPTSSNIPSAGLRIVAEVATSVLMGVSALLLLQ